MAKVNVRYRKVRRFSGNEFWKNIGRLVSDPTFGLGGIDSVREIIFSYISIKTDIYLYPKSKYAVYIKSSLSLERRLKTRSHENSPIRGLNGLNRHIFFKAESYNLRKQ